MKKLLLTLILLFSTSNSLAEKKINLQKSKGINQDMITSLFPAPMEDTVKRGINIKVLFNEKLQRKNIKKSVTLKYLGCKQEKKEKLKKRRTRNIQKCKQRYKNKKYLKRSCIQCAREIFKCQKQRNCKKRKIQGTVKYLKNRDILKFNPNKKLRPGYYQVTVKGLKTVGGKKIKNIRYRFEVSKNYIKNITLTPNSINLKEGENAILTLQATYKDNKTEDITKDINWIIGETSIISIDQNGNLKALKKGETLIQAEYHGKTSKEVKITVESTEIIIPNTPPVAQKQTIIIDEDTNKDILLTAIDQEEDILSFIITAQSSHGALTGIAPNLTYTPNTNYNGSDSFSFKVNDGKLDSSIITVPITITSINDKPTVNAGEDIESIEQLPVTLNATASDIEGEIQSYRWSEVDITLATTASFTKDDFTVGEHTITLTATDREGATANDTVTIMITQDPNTAPTLKAQTLTTEESKPLNITLVASDKENDTLSYIITKQPTKGTITGTAPNLTYTANANFTGSDSFSIKVNDGKLDSEVATIMIEVTGKPVEVIHGHTLPPEPDETLNNSTLLGIDSNGNGVRDDVERWIYHTYKEPIEIGIFMQSARAYQKVIVDPSRAKETRAYISNIVGCKGYWRYFAKENNESYILEQYRDTSREINKIQFNTIKRHIAYERFNGALSGGVYSSSGISKDKCEFNELGILGAIK